MPVAYLSLGSNLGDRLSNLRSALDLIEQVGTINTCSSVYTTEAWGFTEQPDFFNLVVAVSTQLEPVSLLKELLTFEVKLGRVREDKWGARIIDIDILLYENVILNQAGLLTVPHPEMHKRKFVLVPIVEIAPKLIHPVLNVSMSALLEKVQDPLAVNQLKDTLKFKAGK